MDRQRIDKLLISRVSEAVDASDLAAS